MLHPLVLKSRESYYCGSHKNESLMTNFESEEDKNAENFLRKIGEYPHAFVLACLMQTGVDVDVAWSIPYKIYTKIHTFKIDDLHRIENFNNIFSGEQKLHRYYKKKAEVFRRAVKKIVETDFLNTDASKIWSDKPSSRKVILRFMDFHGCGFKIANMAANLLYTYFGIEFSDYNSIDIAPDTHVVRVFQRLGLTPYLSDINIVHGYTVAKARELNPEYPGIVNELCWNVGRDYCNPDPTKLKCNACKFEEFCEKVIEKKNDIWT